MDRGCEDTVSNVNAHRTVTLAEEELTIKLDRMAPSLDSLPLSLVVSIPSGFMKKSPWGQRWRLHMVSNPAHKADRTSC